MVDERRGSPSGHRRADDRRTLLPLLLPELVLVVGAAIRIAHRPALDYDERVFLDVGRQILATGRPFETIPPAHLFFDHTPLYVYLVALVTALGGDTVVILRSLSLLCGLLTVALVFLCGREVRGSASGLVGGLLVATNPFFVTYSWFIRMEVPMALCVTLAVYVILKERLVLAGLTIAAAVMFKEIALAFWALAVLYVGVRRGARAAATIGLATPTAFLAWLVYAASLDSAQLLSTVDRWFRSGLGNEASNPRFHVGDVEWARIIVEEVLGPALVLAGGITVILGFLRTDRVPTITWLALGYTGLAVVASFVMSLKEPRYLIAIVPMLALSVALVVDWDDVLARARAVTTPSARSSAVVTPSLGGTAATAHRSRTPPGADAIRASHSSRIRSITRSA